MLNRFLSYIGFCRHQHIGWPFFDRKERTLTVQCHDCRRRLFYDWDAMRIWPKFAAWKWIVEVEHE